MLNCSTFHSRSNWVFNNEFISKIDHSPAATLKVVGHAIINKGGAGFQPDIGMALGDDSTFCYSRRRVSLPADAFHIWEDCELLSSLNMFGFIRILPALKREWTLTSWMVEFLLRHWWFRTGPPGGAQQSSNRIFFLFKSKQIPH